MYVNRCFQGQRGCLSGPSESGTGLVTCRTHVLFKNVRVQPPTATLPNRARGHERPLCKRRDSTRSSRNPRVSPLPCHTLCVGRPALRKQRVFGDMKCPHRAQLCCSGSPRGPDLQRPRTCTARQTRGEEDTAALAPRGAPADPRAKPRVRPTRVRPRRGGEGLTAPRPGGRRPRRCLPCAQRRGSGGSERLGPHRRAGRGAGSGKCSLGGAQRRRGLDARWRGARGAAGAAVALSPSRRREPHPGGRAEQDAELGRSTFQPVSTAPRFAPRPGERGAAGVSGPAPLSPRGSDRATYPGLAVAVRSLSRTGSSGKAGTLRSARQGSEGEWLCLSAKRGARWARSRGALSAHLPCPLSGHCEEDVSDRDGPAGRSLRAPVCRRSVFGTPRVYPRRGALWLRTAGARRQRSWPSFPVSRRRRWATSPGWGRGPRGVCDVGSAVAPFPF